MANKIFPCFRCNEWFETEGARKTHKCGKVEKEIKKAKAVDVGNIESEENDTFNEEVTDKPVEFDRDAAIDTLIQAEVIRDKRSTTNKSDEDIQAMLAGIK